MDEQACPRCKTTKYRNPSLKLMVNVCGHTLCESCVDLLFLKGSGSCPECRIPLRRNNFRVQLFDDPTIEKDINIRKRILRDYNKKEEDFNSLEEYNNYLEEIEEIIYNLCNDIDIVNTNKRIEQYKKENREVILRNKSKLSKTEYELEELLDIEKQVEESRRQELKEIEVELKKKKQREKEALIDELMFSYEDASKIINNFAEQAEKIREEEKKVPEVKKPTQFSTGIQFTRTDGQGFLSVPKEEEGLIYVYKPLKFDNYGPTPPAQSEIERNGFIKHIRAETPVERAGGYKSIISCQRVLQEAMQGLFFGS
ncbi:CDK-activating kinase assembly factor MAT1 [Condylostylus longicornis]|uniref:CDK-activating kinase assembly factor MAT1 n=1 Tax=Condylostylus longicornis TaxID=2530218 RepID=UPI00244DB7CC|nr:CDK-activating kinase assembly factor MAT1 [Condylostylus longicornis]